MISQSERKKMMRAFSVGPKICDHLEMIGVETLDELKDESAEELAIRIDEALGVKRMNMKLGIDCLENLIEYANNNATNDEGK